MKTLTRNEWLFSVKRRSPELYRIVQKTTPSDLSIYTLLSILEKAQDYEDFIKRSNLFLSERAFQLFLSTPLHTLLNEWITCPEGGWEKQLITIILEDPRP